MRRQPRMPRNRAQDEFLAVTRKSQDAVITAIRTWAETVRTTTERLAPIYDRLPKLPSVTVPFADNFPRPEETVTSAYHLAEQLLASQRRFAEDLLKVMTPLIPGRSQAQPQVPAKQTVAASAPKAPAAPAASSAPKAPAAAAAAPKAAATAAAPKAPAVNSAPKTPAADAAPKPAATAAALKTPAADAAPKA